MTFRFCQQAAEKLSLCTIRRWNLTEFADENSRRMLKKAVRQGRSERKPEARTLWGTLRI
jgi:hypothetical protein